MSTYYVKIGGGGAGTIESPFATITQLNAQALVPGDNIYFNRGDTWTVIQTDDADALMINSYSGSVGSPIFYGAYGNGANPIITTKRSLTGWNTSGNWTDRGSNIWSFNMTGLVADVYYTNIRGRLWLDGVEIGKAESITIPTSSLKWTHTNYTLYVYSAGNPAGVYSNIEIGSSSLSALQCSKNYITIRGIDFQGGGNQSMYFSGANNIIIDNCNIGKYALQEGINFYSSCNNIVISNCIIDTDNHDIDLYQRSETENGIAIGNNCNDFDIYSNTLIDWHHTGIAWYCTSAGAKITNVKFHNNSYTAPDIDYGRPFLYNISTAVGTGVCTGNEIYNNFFYNYEANSQISGDGLKVYSNIFDGTRSCESRTDVVESHLALAAYAGVTINNLIYNNIFANAYSYGIIVNGSGSNATYDNTIANNIFYNNRGAGDGVQLQSYWWNYVGVHNFKNNLFYKTGITNLIQYGNLYVQDPAHYPMASNCIIPITTFNSKNGLGGDVITDNIGGDPLFVDATNANYLLRNYNLSSGSPAIAAGIGVDLTTDYAGNLWNATPSIGAYEYGSSSTTTLAPTTTSDGFTLIEGTWLANRTALNAMYQRLYQRFGIGEIYYVKNGGNDSLDGKSDANAWATISTVNSSTFNHGDQVLFKCGDVWRETLVLPSSGTVGHYITFGSYDTGDKPKILGSTQAVTWEDQTGNVWKCSTVFADDPYSHSSYSSEIFFINIDISITWGSHKINTGALVAEFDWTWAGNYVYVYATSDPGTRYDSVEVPQRQNGIELNDKEYNTIDGLELAFIQSRGFYMSSYPNNDVRGLTIKNCKIHHIGSRLGDNASHGISAPYSDMLIQSNEIYEIGRRSISIYHYSNGFTISNIIIEKNILHNGYHTTGVDIGTGMVSGNFDNIIIRKNKIYDDVNAVQVSATWSELIFIDGGGNGATTTNIKIYNNILMYPQLAGVHLTDIASSYVFNNTFYGFNSQKADNIFFIHFEGINGSSFVKNNIFFGVSQKVTATYAEAIYVPSGGTDYHVIDADYNLYYQTITAQKIITVGGVASYTMADWATMKTALGWETNSPTPVNPIFTNAPTNLRVDPSSPVVGAGISVTDYIDDYESVTVSSPPNIGAYETTSAATPAYVSSVVEDADQDLLEMTYNITLANIVPDTSAFDVQVNAGSRGVNSIAISGTKVRLTLVSAIIFGDVVTVAYTKPVTNPIQTVAGGQVISITAQSVTNNVAEVVSYGPEKITNGNFDATINSWTAFANWAWQTDGAGGGWARHTAGQTNSIHQDGILTVGVTYHCVFTVGGMTTGDIHVSAGSSGIGTTRTANGTYTQNIVCGTTAHVYLIPSTGFDGYVDSISCKEVL